MPVSVPTLGSTLSISKLEAVATDILRQAGMSHVNAGRMAGVLVFAQASGVDSHGLMHLPAYVTGMIDGTVTARPNFKILSVRPGAAILDGDNGPGVLVALTAADRAIQCAASTGVGSVAVRNSGHFGVAAAYVDRMVSRGMIGLVLSNASPTVAPRGGTAAAFGTNPLAAGFPRKNGAAVIIDMATTNGSRARIRKAAREGESIPEDWALDKNGNPTTNAEAALEGSMQAIGGAKGASLGLLVDMLCVALSGGMIGPQVKAPQNASGEKSGVSHLFIAFDTEAFGGVNLIAEKVEEIASAIEATPPADPQQPVRMPGTRAALRREQSRKNGIFMTEQLVDAFQRAIDIVDNAEAHPLRQPAEA
ncbi:MAG: Ldh family oxidoreductase [Alphaproteobacteria bacterium]